MHDHRRLERDEHRPQAPARRDKPGRAAPALLIIMLMLGSLLMGCELLDIAALPTTTAILKEASKSAHSPYEGLERHYELRKDAINTRYDKDIRTIESKLSGGVMTDSEAELKKNLTELKKAQELAILEKAREQREEEIKELAEIIENR